MHALIFGTMPFSRCFVIFLKDFFFGTNLLLLSEGYHAVDFVVVEVLFSCLLPLFASFKKGLRS